MPRDVFLQVTVAAVTARAAGRPPVPSPSPVSSVHRVPDARWHGRSPCRSRPQRPPDRAFVAANSTIATVQQAGTMYVEADFQLSAKDYSRIPADASMVIVLPNNEE